MEEDVVEDLVGELGEVLTLQLIQEIYNDDTHTFKFGRADITDLSALFEAGSKATGGSVLTQNEFRADYLDKGAIDGGDTLVAHPGATQGSVPPAFGAPDRGTTPTPEADLGAEATVKGIEDMLTKALDEKNQEQMAKKAQDAELAHLQDKSVTEHVALFNKHFMRQKAAHESGQLPALNSGRWDRELSADLRALAVELVQSRGETVAKSLNSAFDMGQVQNYLTAGADIVARKINEATVRDVHSDVAQGKSVEQAYDSRAGRAPNLATTRVTQLMSFATLEAARQSDE